MLRYGTLASGVEAPTLGWERLGWEPVFFCENAAFPSAVLKHHYPQVPNLGDMNRAHKHPDFQNATVDLIAGGTPCQDFSIAGLRAGLANPRGNLCLQFLRLVDDKRPRWVVWENVPGVLSSNGGRDFGTFLGALAELGYGFAYRILDAQYFGVPQQRRRVFVVAHIGGWQRAAAVLFDRESLRRSPKKGRKKGAGTARTAADGVGICDTAGSLISNGDGMEGIGALTKSSLSKGGNQAPLCFNAFASMAQSLTPGNGRGQPSDVVPCLTSSAAGTHADTKPHVAQPGGGVRRLTPLECERLQGFPDNYTRIPKKILKHRKLSVKRPADMWEPLPDGRWQLYAADGPRYEVIGNSMAVPVLAWLGQRINMVDQLPQ